MTSSSTTQLFGICTPRRFPSPNQNCWKSWFEIGRHSALNAPTWTWRSGLSLSQPKVWPCTSSKYCGLWSSASESWWPKTRVAGPTITVFVDGGGIIDHWRVKSSHGGTVKPGGGRVPVPALWISMYNSVYRRSVRDIVDINEETWKITDLNMEAFMFVSHHQSPGDISCQGTFSGRQIMVESCKPTTNSITESNDRVECWPVFIVHWDLWMILVMIKWKKG